MIQTIIETVGGMLLLLMGSLILMLLPLLDWVKE